MQPLLEAAPGFARFGRLCAIESFEAIGDRRAAPVLIPWLRSDDDVVREWAADALRRLGADEAVPDLLEAWAASKARETPPDWTEPVAIRRALAALGARRVVLPDAVARAAIDDDRLGRAWPVEALPDVLEQLADAGQVVLYVQYWAPHPRYGRIALTDAEPTALPPETVATIEWLDRGEL